jgi:Putative adhesin
MEGRSMKMKHRTWSVSLAPRLLLLLGLAGSGYSYQLEISRGGFPFSASGQTTRIDTSALTESEKLATQRVEVSSGPNIIVEDRAGSITLSAGSDGVVVVDAEKQADSQNALAEIKIEVSKQNDGVHIRWEPGARTIVNRVVHLTITAPRGSALQLHTGNGPITVAGFERGAEARADFGSIEVNSVKGDLTLRTGNGAVTVTAADGIVAADSGIGAITVKGSKGKRTSARTELGRIAVRQAKGDLTLQTGNGAIEVNNIDGSLIAETALGSINVTGRLAGRNWLHSRNGAITVTLPADSRLTVDASTSNGDIATEFGLPVKGQVRRFATGTLGDGAAGMLEINSSLGLIELLKSEN